MSQIDNDVKLHIRRIKLELINKDIDINIPKLNLLYKLKLGYKILKELRSDAILVGSRALNCYHINGEKILNRKLNDWDFIVDDAKFNEIIKKYKITTIHKNGNYIYLNLSRGIRILTDSYDPDDSGINPFGFDFNIIKMVDDVPYTKVNGWNIAKFNYLLDEKSKLSNFSKNRTDILNMLNIISSNGFFEN